MGFFSDKSGNPAYILAEKVRRHGGHARLATPRVVTACALPRPSRVCRPFRPQRLVSLRERNASFAESESRHLEETRGFRTEKGSNRRLYFGTCLVFRVRRSRDASRSGALARSRTDPTTISSSRPPHHDHRAQATSAHLNGEPDWGVNVDMCDLVNSNFARHGKDCVKALKLKIMKKSAPDRQMLALIAFEMCMKNCGQDFHLMAIAKDVPHEMARLTAAAGVAEEVHEKTLTLIREWAQQIRHPHLQDVYDHVRSKGVRFPPKCSRATGEVRRRIRPTVRSGHRRFRRRRRSRCTRRARRRRRSSAPTWRRWTPPTRRRSVRRSPRRRRRRR